MKNLLRRPSNEDPPVKPFQPRLWRLSIEFSPTNAQRKATSSHFDFNGVWLFLKKFAYSQGILTKKKQIFKKVSLARQQANCHSSRFDALLKRYLSGWKPAASDHFQQVSSWFRLATFTFLLDAHVLICSIQSVDFGLLRPGSFESNDLMLATRAWSSEPIDQIFFEKFRRPTSPKRSQTNHSLRFIGRVYQIVSNGRLKIQISD